MSNALIDQAWMLVCCALVLLMQAGFLCLEAGLTRSKNSVNVAFKNLADLAIAPLVFWLFGAWLMFGIASSSWISDPESGLVIPLLFQSLFCATAATIISGAVAERMRLTAYVVVAGVVCLLIYPTIGSWVWGGAYGGPAGWLEEIGFKDFAGSGVVHMTGGFAALGVVCVLGPRTGRFAPGRREAGFPKSNLPLALLGTLLLFVGWMGFNGGSTEGLSSSVGPVILNTVLAGVCGCTATLLIKTFQSIRQGGHFLAPEVVINGLLGGLAAVCAAADVMQPVEAALVGVVAALAVQMADRVLRRYQIDDVIGAFPVHGVGGGVGIVSAACVAEGEASLTVQLTGLAAIGGAAFFSTFLPLRLLAPIGWLRVSKDEEKRGLNEVEHGVMSEFQVLSQGLEAALRSGSLTTTTRSAAATDATAPSIEPATPTSPTIDPILDEPPADDVDALVQQYSQLLEEASREAAEGVRAEEQSRTAEQIDSYSDFLHAVLDTLDSQVAIVDHTGAVIDSNAAWRAFVDRIGLPNDNGRLHIADVFEFQQGAGSEGDELHHAISAITSGAAATLDAERTLEIDGQRHDLHVRVKPLPPGSVGSAIIVQSDVTVTRENERGLLKEKEKAETLADALETSNKAIELAVNGGNLGLWHWDVSTGYFEVSRDWLVALGHDGDSGADINVFRELLHPEDRVLWTRSDTESVAPDEPYDRQFRLRRANGTYAWTQALGRANVRRADGAPDSISGILLDIDARKNAEMRDAGMAKIIEESFNEVFVVDAETWRFQQINRGARENLGISADEIGDLTPADINGEFDREMLEELVEPLKSGEVGRIEFETVHTRKDESSYPVLISLQRSELLGRAVYVAIGMDLTQRQQLEAQLTNSRKLESIGQLAAGVAHEMNTPLQYVGNNITYLSDCSDHLFDVIDRYQALLSPDAPPSNWADRIGEAKALREHRGFARIRAEMPKALEESLEGVQRVLAIVRAMKEFSHPGEQRMQPNDVNKLITSMSTVTQNRWKHVAEMQHDLDPALPDVRCDGGSLNQVLVNLIVNAADAIADKAAASTDDSPGIILVSTRTEGDHAVIEVKDSGCGMPEELIEKIFDPFFTTKEVGQGTGQGLSLSHTIVTKHHGGQIEVESEVNVGSTFRLRLPFEPLSSEGSPAGKLADCLPAV